MFQAVIFDFDGLLVDTEGPAYDAWVAIYQRFEQNLELTDWVACVGSSYASFDPVAHLSALCGRKDLDRDALILEKNNLKADICSRQPLMPGAAKMLEEIEENGIESAVASSSENQWVTSHLNRLGLLKKFRSVTTREHVARIKPHPDLYLHAAKALSVNPASCLVFEDSLNGVRAAKAAGMWCVAVPNRITRGLDFSEADEIWDSLEGSTIRDVFRRLGG